VDIYAKIKKKSIDKKNFAKIPLPKAMAKSRATRCAEPIAIMSDREW
jgi:hypothetical protein